MSIQNHKLNELEMSLKIAMKAIDKLMEEKPKGGLILHKGESTESKMSYAQAKLCLERIDRMFGGAGAYSFGICGCCDKWDTKSHGTGKWGDFGTCKAQSKSTHRYHSCESHSKKNGGWGL